jgi:hypothetical protein
VTAEISLMLVQDNHAAIESYYAQTLSAKKYYEQRINKEQRIL